LARRRTVGLLGAGVVTNAVVTLAPQLMALIVLAPHDYATFGVLFIALGLTYSAQNSTVIDPWLRSGAHVGNAPGGPLLWSSVALGAVASVVPLALGYVSVSELALVLAGLLLAQLRWGMRLIEVGCGRWLTAIVSDVLFLLGFVVTAALVWDGESWTGVWLPLTVASALALGANVRIRLSTPRAAARWFADRRRTIAPLWVESTILDLGVSAPPLILAKIMPAAEFAVVRAASSALLPVRLVLTPLRGWIATRRPAAALRPRNLFVLVAGATLMGAAIGLALRAVAATSFASGGVLPLVAEYSLPIAAMAAIQCLSSFVYIVARGHASPKDLLVGRVVDSVCQLVIVVGSYSVAGLGGVMAAYVIISATSLAVWLVVVVRTERQVAAAVASSVGG
jgi:hypothetical protein